MAARTREPVRPHLGRSDEEERALAAVTATGGNGALLAGPAGVGKSHLLDRVATHLASRGWSLVRTQGDPARSQPFDAFGDLLPPLAGTPDRWALVLRTGVDHLVAGAGPGRPLLVADDLQAFDPASAALLQQAVNDGRVRLLGTLRTGEPAPDAVTSLWKHDLVDWIEVPPLARDEVAELSELLVGGPIDGSTRDRLWTWTGGNPLLVTDIVEQGRLHGGWHRHAGLWHLAGVSAPRLAGLLDERLAGCSDEVVDLLDAVALAGRLPIPVADALVGRSTVATAERLRLVRVRLDQGRAGIAPDHPLYGELRRSAMADRRQVALHNRLIDVVESPDGLLGRPGAPPLTPGGEPVPAAPSAGGGGPAAPGANAPALGAADRALVARWYLLTGRVGPRTVELLVAAAERAWGGNDPDQAAALARRAYELGPDDRVGLLLVSALARTSATDEVEELASRLASTAASDRVRVQAALLHALAWFQFSNRPDHAREVLAEAARHLADQGWRDLLAAEAASYMLQMGQVAAAVAEAEAVAGSANRRAAAEASGVLAAARALQGRIADSVAAADRGEALARAVPDFVDVSQFLFHKLVALVDDGQVALAAELALAAVEDLPAADPFGRAFMALSLGRALRLRGRPVAAARWFREAAAGFDAVARRGFAAWSFAGLAAVLAEVGDVEGAGAAAERYAAYEDHPIRVGIVEARRSLAWLHVARGDLDAAAARMDEVADRGMASGELVHAGHALYDLVRLGRVEWALDRLRDLAGETDSAILALYADHAAAVVAEDRDGIEAAAARFEDLGCELAAAEAWSLAARLGDPPPEGPVSGRDGREDGSGRREDRAGRDLDRRGGRGDGEAHRRGRGNDGGRVGRVIPLPDRRAVAAARRAAALAARCEGVRSPLLALPSRARVLTDRELEVARMAARGENRKAIAERLVVSPRTVDSHLQRIYRKLGVTNREALAQALAEDAADPGTPP